MELSDIEWSDSENGEEAEQITIRCVLQRGGTSKALYFHESDLPISGPERDALLLRLMGSPDVLQIDGLGGSRPITSKVAIVSKSERPEADVDYTFAQVEIERAHVTWQGNCGNISSGVGPFAIDEGLIPAQDGITVVRIYNTNTQKVLVAHVPVRNGKARVSGTFAIPGVPGTGAEIIMDWSGTIGAKSGRLLPTNNPVDTIVMETGEAIEFTLSDAGNVCIWAAASSFGLEGSEPGERFLQDLDLMQRIREVRGKVARMLGVCPDWRCIDKVAPGLMLGLVAAPDGYLTLNGRPVAAEEMDIRVRLIFMNRLHESIAGTASVSLAAASRVPGSVVERLVQQNSSAILRIGHASGVTLARVASTSTDASPFVHFEHLGFSRTSRRLMSCDAYYPRDFSPAAAG